MGAQRRGNALRRRADVTFQAQVWSVLKFKEMFALDVDCADECGHKVLEERFTRARRIRESRSTLSLFLPL